MLFELKFPWVEWIIPTNINNQLFNAKIDSGAFITLVGIDIAVELGLTSDFIKKQRCIKYVGVVEELKGYAFKVPCSSLPLGNEAIPVSEIYVPFTFVDKIKYRFVSTDRFLIGTDILNKYNLNVNFNNNATNKEITTAFFEMQPHSLKLPKRRSSDYTLNQLAKTIGEVQLHIDDSMVEEVPPDYNRD